MEMPWDYEETARWFLNDESLYNMGIGANSADELWRLCSSIGMLKVGEVQLTKTNVAYAWDCIRGKEAK